MATHFHLPGTACKKKKIPRAYFPLFFGMLLWAAAMAQTAVLSVGSELPAISLPDQHARQVSITADTRLILFAASKQSAELVNEYLSARDAEFLAEKKAFFVSDISGMPGMVTRLFALPKMRKFAYPVLLVLNEGELAFLPRQEQLLTCLLLRDNQIQEIAHIASAAELDDIFSR